MKTILKLAVVSLSLLAGVFAFAPAAVHAAPAIHHQLPTMPMVDIGSGEEPAFPYCQVTSYSTYYLAPNVRFQGGGQCVSEADTGLASMWVTDNLQRCYPNRNGYCNGLWYTLESPGCQSNSNPNLLCPLDGSAYAYFGCGVGDWYRVEVNVQGQFTDGDISLQTKDSTSIRC